MRKTNILIIMSFCALLTFAQDNSIILTQSGLPYTYQTWFSSGYGNDLQTDKIKQYWDDNRYITSAAYTLNGWFVTMTRNCGFTGQTYYYSKNSPWDWVKEKWDEGYYLTTVASNEQKWFFVMSKGVNYTSQSYWTNSSKKGNIVALFIKMHQSFPSILNFSYYLFYLYIIC